MNKIVNNNIFSSVLYSIWTDRLRFYCGISCKGAMIQKHVRSVMKNNLWKSQNFDFFLPRIVISFRDWYCNCYIVSLEKKRYPFIEFGQECLTTYLTRKAISFMIKIQIQKWTNFFRKNERSKKRLPKS